MLSDEEFEALKTKHGDVHKLQTRVPGFDIVEIVVRRPSAPLYRKFRKQASKPEARDAALEDLVRDIVLVPNRVDFDKLLEKLPGLCEEFAKPVMELVGITDQARTGE